MQGIGRREEKKEGSRARDERGQREGETDISGYKKKKKKNVKLYTLIPVHIRPSNGPVSPGHGRVLAFPSRCSWSPGPGKEATHPSLRPRDAFLVSRLLQPLVLRRAASSSVSPRDDCRGKGLGQLGAASVAFSAPNGKWLGQGLKGGGSRCEHLGLAPPPPPPPPFLDVWS